MDKICNKCKVSKRFIDFYENSALADGHNYACKDCEKAYQKAYKKNKRANIEFREAENKKDLARYHKNSNKYNKNQNPNE